MSETPRAKKVRNGRNNECWAVVKDDEDPPRTYEQTLTDLDRIQDELDATRRELDLIRAERDALLARVRPVPPGNIPTTGVPPSVDALKKGLVEGVRGMLHQMNRGKPGLKTNLQQDIQDAVALKLAGQNESVSAALEAQRNLRGYSSAELNAFLDAKMKDLSPSAFATPELSSPVSFELKAFAEADTGDLTEAHDDFYRGPE